MLVVWGKARILVDVTQARVRRWCGAETGDPPGSPAILPRHPHEASISLASLCVTNSSEKDAALLSLQLRTHSTPHRGPPNATPSRGEPRGGRVCVCWGDAKRVESGSVESAERGRSWCLAGERLGWRARPRGHRSPRGPRTVHRHRPPRRWTDSAGGLVRQGPVKSVQEEHRGERRRQTSVARTGQEARFSQRVNLFSSLSGFLRAAAGRKGARSGGEGAPPPPSGAPSASTVETSVQGSSTMRNTGAPVPVESRQQPGQRAVRQPLRLARCVRAPPPVGSHPLRGSRHRWGSGSRKRCGVWAGPGLRRALLRRGWTWVWRRCGSAIVRCGGHPPSRGARRIERARGSTLAPRVRRGTTSTPAQTKGSHHTTDGGATAAVRGRESGSTEPRGHSGTLWTERGGVPSEDALVPSVWPPLRA